ncbi:MAG: type II toxin-antitoxin system CcdA family antitoxin [Rhizobiaceae bacterium]|nr:type II toxin-antitoxin system CcdA family antitoxin [Rhizobiaceae bacterium]
MSRAERERLWLKDNEKAIAAANAWVEEHGLPLARYRQF